MQVLDTVSPSHAFQKVAETLSMVIAEPRSEVGYLRLDDLLARVCGRRRSNGSVLCWSAACHDEAIYIAATYVSRNTVYVYGTHNMEHIWFEQDRRRANTHTDTEVYYLST